MYDHGDYRGRIDQATLENPSAYHDEKDNTYYFTNKGLKQRWKPMNVFQTLLKDEEERKEDDAEKVTVKSENPNPMLGTKKGI